MSDLTISQPQQRMSRGEATNLRVTGKLKYALDLMVWDNIPDNEAAVTAKMNVLSIRNALKKPHVRTYFQAQQDVLRERESPRNIHTLISVRDGTNQMARVQAVRALERQSDEQQTHGSRQQSPGLVVQIINQQPALTTEQPRIEPKPLIKHTSGGDRDAE